MYISAIVEQVITFGFADRLKAMGRVHGNFAAAGDPSVIADVKEIVSQLIGVTTTVKDRKYRFVKELTFGVVGNSMLPKGIKDGDALLLEPYQDDKMPEYGDFIVIKVDDAYYKEYNRKSSKYETKLRMALMPVTAGMTADDIIEQLRPWHKAILVESYQDHLRDKYKKARKFYKQRTLVLSITYHDEFMRYSFHPADLIVGKAVLRARKNTKNGEIEYDLL